MTLIAGLPVVQRSDDRIKQSREMPFPTMKGIETRALLGLLTQEELAATLLITPETLALWRSKGTGPDYCRLGKGVFYTRWAVSAWIRVSQVTPGTNEVTPEGN